jgi:nucleoside phosphorylase
LPPGSDPPEVWFGHTVSTDFFAYDTFDDHFGLRLYDPDIRAVEMDDAAVAMAASDSNVAFMSVRNASDPVMPNYSKASSAQAVAIYQKYGYWTTVNSALGVWALIIGLE